MKTLTVRDFCSQDKEKTPIPALAAKIEEAQKEHQEGKTLRFESAEAAKEWFDSL